MKPLYNRSMYFGHKELTPLLCLQPIRSTVLRKTSVELNMTMKSVCIRFLLKHSAAASTSFYCPFSDSNNLWVHRADVGKTLKIPFEPFFSR